MYKYYSELENPKNFKIYLERVNSPETTSKYIFDRKISNDLLKKYHKLFEQLRILNELIKSYAYQRQIKSEITAEEFIFLERCEEEQTFENILKILPNPNLNDIKFLLTDYYNFAQFFITIFPKFQEFLKEISINLSLTISEIEQLEYLIFPPKSKIVEQCMPNAWFITPNGYLYNTGIKHKEGNLTYSFWDIFKKLKNEENISCKENYAEKIKDILARNFVSETEYQAYANSVYKLPTIYTPEIQTSIESIHAIRNIDTNTHLKVSQFNPPIIERSYQPNIIKLIIGFYDAKLSLYRSFEKINTSKRKDELAKKIEASTLQSKEELLIRFSGFHKIESCEKKITTSSLYGIRNFQEYLNKGWDLYIVPCIGYDKTLDDIFEMNINEYFISNFLDKELENYKGKGKVLIRDKNC